MNGLTAVSLFAGVGGFDLALQRSGADVVAAVEIDADCRGVLARHFPQTALFNDVSEVTGDQLRAAGLVPGRGILAGGFPCQDLSVAGRRAGLDGARSGLFWEFHRLAEELRPAWLLIENVPGMLSSNGGGDFRIVMDALSDLGYIIDPNIYDAQHFGVPQRRRRVFLICQLLDHSLQSKTTSSALMLAQCLIETSLLSLTVLSQGSARGSAPWDSPARCADGLRKRIKLFGMERQLESICKTWLPVLAGESVRQALARSTSASPPGSSTAAATGQKAAMSSPDSTLPAGVTSLSTASSWRKLLADLLPIAKSCTTSTPSKQATSQAIFTCARALLNISEYIAALSSSSPNSWQPVSSASTAIEVLTKYARSADGDLLAELNGLHDLVDLIAPAERARRLFVAGCLGDGAAAAEVLLEPESGDGNPAAGREAGPGDAGAPSGRAGIPRTVGTLGTTSPGGGWRCGADEAAAGQLVAATLQGGGRRGHRIDAEGAAGGHLIAAPLTAGSATGDGVNKPGRRQEDDVNLVTHALTSEGADASEDGTGRGTPLVAVPVSWRGRGMEAGEENVANALRSAGDGHVGDQIGYVMSLAVAGDFSSSEDVAQTIRAAHGQPGNVGTAETVRRLTPLECERLQGFPDDWTRWQADGTEQSDSARYRQCGNAVAVPVVQWITERLVKVDSDMQFLRPAA